MAKNIHYIKLRTNTDYYSTENAANASMSVREFIAELSNYNLDAKIVFFNDGGYTKGAIDSDSIGDGWYEPEDDDEEEWPDE